MREAQVAIDDAGFEDLGIGELLSLFQTAGIRDIEALACHGDRSVIHVGVDSRVDEAQLQSLEYVDEWDRIAGVEDGSQYVIAFSVPGASAALTDHIADLVGTCEPDVTEEGATVSLVGSQTTIAAVVEAYGTQDGGPDLRKLGDYHGREEALDELTERQREVLKTAWQMGYYEVPREVSTTAVAAELNVDPSTIAEHLQRAERNLLAHHLSE